MFLGMTFKVDERFREHIMKLLYFYLFLFLIRKLTNKSIMTTVRYYYIDVRVMHA